MLIVIIALLNLGGLLLLARAIGNLRAETQDQIAAAVAELTGELKGELQVNLEAEVRLHRLGRRLIIQKVLPALGYSEPQRTEAEKAIIEQMGAELEAAARGQQ